MTKEEFDRRFLEEQEKGKKVEEPKKIPPAFPQFTFKNIANLETTPSLKKSLTNIAVPSVLTGVDWNYDEPVPNQDQHYMEPALKIASTPAGWNNVTYKGSPVTFNGTALWNYPPLAVYNLFLKKDGSCFTHLGEYAAPIFQMAVAKPIKFGVKDESLEPAYYKISFERITSPQTYTHLDGTSSKIVIWRET